MTLKQALLSARQTLAENKVEDAPLEGELLLRYALNIDRVQLYLDLDRELSPQEEETFQRLVERRSAGEPTAYITGHREFYGLDFYVNSNVLIPRPESEVLVETALSIAKNHSLSIIADVGTGSGAIAVSLALELSRIKIYAIDISATALEVARLNCQRHRVAGRVYLLKGSLLEPLPQPVDLIIANLPYVRQSELAPLNFEPRLALDGGLDGMEWIRQLCRQASGRLKAGGSLLLEIGQGQREAVTALLRSLFAGGKIEIIPDLGGADRVVTLRPAISPVQLDTQPLHC